MTHIPTPAPRLPPDDAISARSRKFYDGTYTWDAEGFTDEHGVYRAFDCYDAAARAPTPLPPVFDSEDEDEDERGNELSEELERELFGTPVREENIAAGGLGDKKGVLGEFGMSEELDCSDVFVFASRDGDVVVKRDDLFVGFSDRDGLVARLEGLMLACRHLGRELSLEECYELCGAEASVGKLGGGKLRSLTKLEDDAKNEEKAEQVVVDVLEKPKIGTKKTTPGKEESSPSVEPRKTDNRRISIDSSGLSDVPSDLSDQSPSRKHSIPPSKKTLNHQKSSDHEAENKPLRKTATRGIAQKVRKSTRKATAAKSKPAKKTNSSPSLAAIHSGVYRRSARQEAKLGTGQ